MVLIDFTNLTTEIVAGLAVAAVVAVTGLLYTRRKKRELSTHLGNPAPVEKLKPTDIEKLGVKRSFYLPFPPDQVIPRIAVVLEPDCLLLDVEKSLKNMGDFIKNSLYFLQKRDPKKYNEIKNQKPNMDDFIAQIRKEARFRATTPVELKVRIVSQFENATYCEAECYPELYSDLITEKSTPQDESEKVVRLATNQCRMLVNDMVARLGGRLKPE